MKSIPEWPVKTWKRFLLVCSMATLASGCALTTDYVTLSYAPQTGINKIVGAEAIKVDVEVLDVRAIRDKVSAKKNGYGMEMAPIIAKEDVATTIATAIESELANRGFIPGAGSVRLLAELQKFYNDFKTGFWSGTAAAELIMNVQIKKSDGTIVYSRLVAGEGNIPGIQLASGENARNALDAALKDAVAKLFDDGAFIQALFKAVEA
ncbi:MAG TPA: YajG family lipoprotein [Candidatus Acidoferrales bacterium]|nr:YajG family lipoprotein [Candidatus Acidoferrales bacterium]